MDHEQSAGSARPFFSYLEPDTFSSGTTEQRQALQSIADEEFSLSHLPDEDQELLQEALRFSGVEVHPNCTVDVAVDGSLGAFLRRYEEQEHRQFNPRLGMLDLSPKEDSGASPTWQPMSGSQTAYPYPFGDRPVIPKLVPVNLSTIQVQAQNEHQVDYQARPSALLFAPEKPENRILDAEDLIVRFSVDKKRERLTELSIQLETAKKVYFAIRIRELDISYEFADDERTGNNVVSRIQAGMSGRLGLVFKPNFSVATSLTYGDCQDSHRRQSYLYASMDSIRNLEQTASL